MRKAGLIIAVAGVVGLFGAVGAAHAQTTTTAPAPKGKAPLAADARGAARDAFTLDQSQGRQVLELDANKHWGFKLEMQQPVTRDLKLKDVEAGAYYKFNQTFRLGGAVGLTDKNAPDAAARIQQKAREQVTPKAKLTAMFKF
jgi:hypothetical protein